MLSPAEYVLKFINQTRENIFLTGQAGTGKTTLLREIIASTHKNTVVVAPTGIAALNAGGVTIHSFFHLPFATFIPDRAMAGHFANHINIETQASLRRHLRFSSMKQAVVRSLELLVIDEVSMLRADLLDAIDFALRTVRRNATPFGGVQVLFIGDLLQLPPVVKPEQWDILKPYYTGCFFFHARVLQQHPPLYIELSKIYRQQDGNFISLLNNLRNNRITSNDIEILNNFVKPGFEASKQPGCVILTTHNAKADVMNAEALAALDGRTWIYEPEIVGEFPDKLFPVDAELRLKEGAQVMFIKNDPSAEKQYFNGKTGIIASLSEAEILVHFPGEDLTIEVDRYEWSNIRYTLDVQTREIKEEILGTFTHYPIKLAWAITVHKSQGLTFDYAALDVAEAFAPGQAYVALSRLRSLNGLTLLSPIRMNGISNDAEVTDYARHKADESVLETKLQQATRAFIRGFLAESFSWNSLASAWHAHADSYQDEGPKSVKGPFSKLARDLREQVADLVVPGQKFIQQIHRIFDRQPFDQMFLAERTEAAYGYFFPLLDKLFEALLAMKYEVGKIKKTKAYLEELSELEDIHIESIQRLQKARRAAALFAAGKPFEKADFTEDNTRNYRLNKIARLRESLAAKSEELDEQALSRKSESREKRKKEPKKPTVEETYLLWQKQLTIREIAKERKLTPQTISNHIVKLIQAGTVNIRDVLPEDKIIALARAFIGFEGEALNPLKEKYGDAFTWDELKMFKASLGQESQKTAMTAGIK